MTVPTLSAVLALYNAVAAFAKKPTEANKATLAAAKAARFAELRADVACALLAHGELGVQRNALTVLLNKAEGIATTMIGRELK